MYRYSFILLIFICSCSPRNQDGTLQLIEASPDKGFNFPYYLFLPEEIPVDKESILIIEPNNSGFVSDEFERHLGKAERTAGLDFYTGNYVARKLNYPLLVPVFPRSESMWQVYTHALDRDVVLQERGELKRIDLQLIAMAEDAGKRLKEMGFQTDEQFFMTGFSASGTFVNRFTAIHPEKVKAAAAGGVNGLLFLPLNEINGEKLIYPVGTNDFEDLFGKPFNQSAFMETPQFIFMGEMDDNDAVPYDDAFSRKEQELIFRTLGREMQPERWKACCDIYEYEGVAAQLKTYKGTAHEQPSRVKNDILEFFRSNTEIL